jgi:hypothetical protein
MQIISKRPLIFYALLAAVIPCHAVQLECNLFDPVNPEIFRLDTDTGTYSVSSVLDPYPEKIGIRADSIEYSASVPEAYMGKWTGKKSVLKISRETGDFVLSPSCGDLSLGCAGTLTGKCKLLVGKPNL